MLGKTDILFYLYVLHSGQWKLKTKLNWKKKAGCKDVRYCRKLFLVRGSNNCVRETPAFLHLPALDAAFWVYLYNGWCSLNLPSSMRVCCFWTKNHRKKTGGICDYCYWMVSISYSLGSTDFMLCLLKGLDEIWKVNLIRQGLRWTQSTNYSPDKWMVTVVCNIVWNTDLFGILSDNHSQAGRHQSHIIRFLPCTISNNLHLSGVFI